MRRMSSVVIAPVLLVTTVATRSPADPFGDTWIFRSAVAPGQSMWGAGAQDNYNFADTYEYQAGIFKAGFQWQLQADRGTVFGNVEGNVTAQYDKLVNTLGNTTVTLSYAGIENESQIGTTAGVELSGQPYIGVEFPWPIPDLDLKLPIQFVDVDVDTKQDFTTGLDATASASGRYVLIPFNAELVLVSADLNAYLDSEITFVPNTITGTMKYVHLDTQTERQVPVTIGSDTDVVSLQANLDLPGVWEFTLEDFIVSENNFTQQLDLGLDLGIGVPILSAELRLDVDLFNFWEASFPLDFLHHGYDGDAETPDRLGKWCVYAVPEPTVLAFLLLGGGLLLRRRRRTG